MTSGHNTHKRSVAVKTVRRPWYRRKWFLVPVSVLLGVALLTLLAFRLSPWPGALIIRNAFDSDGLKVRQALEQRAPQGVAKLADERYDTKNPDELLDVYYPSQSSFVGAQLPVVIWTHGGAWLSGDKADIEPYARMIASKGYAVVSVNYTLAPARSYPTQIEQLNQAHKYIVANAQRFHIDPNNIFLAGDSAGSQLSAQLAALVTNPDYAKEIGITPSLKSSQLKGVILNCGIYKMEGLTQAEPSLPKLITWGDNVAMWSYAGTRDFTDPVIRQMSPYYHATKDFPATYITGGNADLLTDAQSKPFADKLESLGVEVTRLFYAADHQPALPHEYQFHFEYEADAQKALDTTLSFVQSHAQ